MNDPSKEVRNAVGVMAEISLVFYRSLVQAGATAEEARTLCQVYIAAMVHGEKD